MKTNELANVQSAHEARKILDMPAPAHQFLEPENLNLACGGMPVLVDLIATPAFQRLRGVHFLGAIDYSAVPYPNGKTGWTRHTRYHHSIGVMQLALYYAELREIDTRQRAVLGAAALLHDIGHPPLSHSIEPVFKQILDIDHHRASIDIIRGEHPFGAQVLETLHNYGVDANEVVAILSGQDAQFEGFFSGPINFDTIEGILRTYRYSNDSETLHPAMVIEAATLRHTTRHQEIVDEFWTHKQWVYEHLIHSEKGILSDHVCMAYLQDRIEQIDNTWLFIDDKELFHRLEGLKELLLSDSFESRALQRIEGTVHFTKRDYFVDERGDFFAREDTLRYQNTRSTTALSREPSDYDHLENPGKEAQQDLFHVHRV